MDPVNKYAFTMFTLPKRSVCKAYICIAYPKNTFDLCQIYTYQFYAMNMPSSDSVGSVCPSEKYAIGTVKPHDKCKVLKHKNLCKKTKKRPNYCICLFICLFVRLFVCLFICLFVRLFVCLFVCLFFIKEYRVIYFKCNELKDIIVVCPHMTKFAQCQYLRNVSEWHIFQNGMLVRCAVGHIILCWYSLCGCGCGCLRATSLVWSS